MSVRPDRSPWVYLPGVYFQQGVPVMIVQALSVILYKKMGLPNDQIAFWTSLISWPWIVKLLWAPWIESRMSRRGWVILTQALITAGLALSGFLITTEYFFEATLVVFFVIAFLSATHDIALDGYYMLALSPERQAFFVGIRSAAFRLAMIFCTGALVMAAGGWESAGLAQPLVWSYTLFLAAAVYGVCMIYALWALPRAPLDRAVSSGSRGLGIYRESVGSFFSQPGILVILLFILLYRFGESMLSKMSGPFLLDARAQGGLELSTSQVGMVLGNVGIISLTLGGFLGGVAISRWGLRRCLWPMILSMNVPNLFYVWAAYAQPGLEFVYPLVAVDQFGYGFGMAALAVYTMYVSQGSKHETSHFAIATGVMAAGAMLAGMVSGWLQMRAGYPQFFVLVCLCTVPAMILMQLIPLDRERLESSADAALQATEA